MKKAAVIVVLVLAFFSWGCDNSSDDNQQAGPVVVSSGSMFVEGCPVAGRSVARPISSPQFKVDGPDGLGRVGDYLLMNEHAAFVVQGTTHVNTYYYYGGIPIDAVALNGCAQAGPERFEEMMMMFGKLDISDLPSSYLRAFKGEWAEVLNDGSTGQPAVVRVHGTDATFWLTELEMIMMFLDMGKPTLPSPPQLFDIFVDYILPPDSNVMTIEFNVHNTQATQKEIMTGLANFFGDSTDPILYPSQTNMSVPSLGITLDSGLEWVVASRGDGAWAVAMKGTNISTVYISGVHAVLDADKAIGTPIVLEPDGQPGDTGQAVYYLSVGASGYNSAIAPLAAVNPEPIPGMTYQLVPFDGVAYDIMTGQPVENARIQIQFENASLNWVFLDGFYSGADGHFGGQIPLFDVGPIQYRMVATANGRNGPAPTYFFPALNNNFNAGFMPGGLFQYEVRDETGRLIPAKILLWQGGKVIYRIFSASGVGSEEVTPGIYDVSVTRGIEYTTYQGTVTVPANNSYFLNVILDHAVDTTGFMSSDNHIHAGPSGDNTITIEERARSLAAEGLDVAVSTDHENVISWQPGIDQNNLRDWVAYVQGEEVSCGIPGHTNIYPILSRLDVNARGWPVECWNSQVNPNYAMDVEELFAAERARGAQIVQVNHPRSGIFSQTNYDRATGLPTEDPANIGMRPGAVLWDWGFDSFELMNGIQNPFVVAGKEKKTGTFEDWMSFLNLGHPKTALGGSDAHDYDLPSYPRNYFPTTTDSPRDFNVNEMIQNIKKGNVLISLGAFAKIKIDNTAEMGDTVVNTTGTVNLWLHIEGIPEIDVTYFKVFVNCDEVLNILTTDPNAVVKYDGAVGVPVSADSHIEVIGFGADFLPRGMPQFDPARVPRFVTNAIFVDADGNGYTALGVGKTCTYSFP